MRFGDPFQGLYAGVLGMRRIGGSLSVVSAWLPPAVDMFKLNFDDASFGNPGPGRLWMYCEGLFRLNSMG